MSHILIIDDEAGIRKLLRVILERQGYDVETAHDGVDGLRKFRQRPADLVITDLIMPNKEGMEVIMELRREHPDLNIIAISGGGRVDAGDYLKLAEKLGCQYGFCKPIDREELLAAVTKILPQADTSEPLDLNQRSDQKSIEAVTAKLVVEDNLVSLMETMPHFYWILNQHRQVVLANSASLTLLKKEHVEDLYGRRPGEILHCLQASESPNGCGCSRLCETCSAFQAISSAETGEADSQDSRISQEHSGDALDLRVWATPMELGGERLTVFQAQDIAHEKRREALEHTFFHDILNIAGGLANGLGMMPELTADEQLEVATMLGTTSRTLVDEIQAHKDLLAIENGTYTLEPKTFKSGEILQAAVACFKHHPVAVGRELQSDGSTEDVTLTSDPRLVSRVVGNMVKNALEASDEGGLVSMGCRVEEQTVCFWVHNATHMPPEVQDQLFKRSFSTKGQGRGLGTFSMQILSERYLQGKISFTSTIGSGTTFKARYPLTL